MAKIAATFSSTGTPAQFVHPAEASHGDLGSIAKNDCILAFSNSGQSNELKDIINYAKRFSVPILSIFSKKMHQAVGTSAVLGFFIALPGAISYIFLGINIEGLPPYSIGYVNILIVALVISTSIFTANIGAKLSSRISKEFLKKIFAIFLLFTCTSLVIEHFII